MKSAILTIALACSPVAFANNASTLFTLGNDRDATVITYSVTIVGDALTGFEATPGEHKPTDTFSAVDVAKPAGVVLLSGQGHDVLFLQGSVDGKSGEGRFHLKYLSNGLTGSYSTCDFLLKKNGTNFFAQNAYSGARITSAKILTWSLGLDTLQGICQ
jgi:hypothetical protein